MATSGTQRKLTAILSADAVGYSRLMQDDEEATLRALTESRTLFADHVRENRGRIVNTPGDSVLAEFASVVDALKCAVAIQQELAGRNRHLPEQRRMHYRIGVNLGDVLVDADGIYGDGVNIAARLESLAEPGGICVSRTVHDQVSGKLSLGFEYLGEKPVKNIAQPVRVYRVLIETPPREEAGLVAQNAAGRGEAPHLPEMPSIAVLAFENMSGDAEQGYFSDGIAEDIITDLSKLSGLLVIARNSSFAFKGRAVDTRQIGRELGVRYLLEGSVRKAGNRVRITAQLVDAQSGRHLWAERYDRDLEDMFALQDEITEEVVTALNVTLVAGEQARLWRKSLKNPKAREVYYQGRSLLNQGTREATAQASRLFRQVIEWEPDSPLGYAGTAWAQWREVFRGWSRSPAEDLHAAMELVQQALERDGDHAAAHAILGCCLILTGRHEQALTHAERAVTLTPNGADVAMFAGHITLYSGQVEQAIALSQRAIRLCPVCPPFYKTTLGVAYREARRYDEGIAVLREAVASEPEFLPARFALLTVYCAAGRYDEAQATAREIRRIDPLFSLVDYANRLPHRDQAVRDRILIDLEKAGVI